MTDTVTKYPVKWHRSTLLCAFLVAVTGFTCPGIYSALNGMGAGGGASPDVTNAANAIVFGVITVGSLFVGGVINRITPKWGLVIGTLGYTPYAAGLYLVDRDGTSWLLIFGSVLLGLSACFLWVSAGAILLGYSEENRKGTAISFNFTLQNLGGSIGGIMSLALNATQSWRGSVSHATYIVLMTLMCVGVPFALALPAAGAVQRTDGKPVVLEQQPSFAKEYQVLKRIITRPAILALLPVILSGQWFFSYQGQYNYAYFTVRARALNTAVYYLVSFVVALCFGQILDWTRFRRRTRAKIGLWIYGIFTGASWIVAQAAQAHYSKTEPTFDWSDSGFGLGCFVYTFWGFCGPLVTSFTYWISGTLSNEVNEVAFIAGIINSVGSLGSTLGFVMSAKGFDYNGQCGMNTALFFLSFPPLAWVVYKHTTDTTEHSQFEDKQHDDSEVTSEQASALQDQEKKGPEPQITSTNLAEQ